MDIGSKIRDARLAAGLTQEKAAEALRVSRQTISNWETGKTYPDIGSVVRMSDLYDISLDRLLKEEKTMSTSTYVDYLGQSTDVVKSKNTLSRLILIIAYLGIWALGLVVFWFFIDGSQAMGYGFMFLWVLLPVTTFVISLLIGLHDHWGRWKWFAAIAFGVMYMLAEYATFSAANMVSFNNLNLPNASMVIGGTLVSLLGLGIGVGVNHLKSRTKN